MQVEFLDELKNQTDISNSVFKLFYDSVGELVWTSDTGPFSEYIIKNVDSNFKLDRLVNFSKFLLNSKSISTYLSIPIMTDSTLVGYIQVISAQKRSESEISLLKTCSKHLSNRLALFHKRKLQYSLSVLQRDKATIFSLLDANNFNSMLDILFEYLEREFTVELGCLWNYIEHDIKDDRDIIALRHYKLGQGQEKYEASVVENSSFLAHQSLCGILLSNLINSKIKQDYFLIDFKESELKSKFEFLNGQHWLGLPIKTRDPIQKERYWGIISLRLSKVDLHHNGIINPKRLANLSKNISLLFESNIYKRRYKRIMSLNQAAENINLDNSSKVFYENILQIVSSAIKSDDVSLFLKHSYKEGLFLQSTTSSLIANYDNLQSPIPIDVKLLINNQEIIYDLKSKSKGAIAISFIESKPILIYDLWDKHITDLVDKSFIEGPRYKRQSVMIMPLIDFNGNAYGVIRCMSRKKEVDMLINSFTEDDLMFFQSISRHLSLYILHQDNKNNDNEKYVNFAHETRSPMHLLSLNVNILEHAIERQNIKGVDIHESILGIKEEYYSIQNQLTLLDYALRGTVNVIDSIEKKPKVLYTLLDKSASLFWDAPCTIVIKEFSKKLKVLIDPESFSRVLFNILNNAVRYSTSPYRQITIVVKANLDTLHFNKGLSISVSNYGIGVSSEEKSAIFNVSGYRSKSAIEKVPTGTGVGLKFCSDIMTRHDGDIQLTMLKNPTIFTIYLPKERVIQ